MRVIVLILQITIEVISSPPAPDVAPEVTVQRVNGTHMNVSWTPLNLADARGDVISYTIQYTPTDDSSESMTVNVSGSHTYVVIGDLNPQLTYQVEVWANTAAGSGKASDPEDVPLPAGKAGFILSLVCNSLYSFPATAGSSSAAAVAGVVVALVLVAVIVAVVVVVCW